MSYRLGKEPGQHLHWGIRYANWVTLQGIDGHVVSVIAVHLTPETEITTGLQEVGVINLGILANQLAAAGPVLMAGDMNFHYGPLQYPRDLLASYGFTSTYDVTGTFSRPATTAARRSTTSSSRKPASSRSWVSTTRSSTPTTTP